MPGPAKYFGPTEPMQQVVQEINANNLRIPTLWARISFEATIVDPETSKSTFVNGDTGTLLYRKPQDLRLKGTKPGVTVFELGSNSTRYWLLSPAPGPDTMWWGNYRNIGKPCSKDIPIRPDMVLEVLGVGAIDADFLHEPSPVMRFNNDNDAYMFVWQMRVTRPNRWAAQKEIWYDRQSKLPKLVVLFDENGRIVLRAYLSNHKPVGEPVAGMASQPMVATRYELLFPDTKSQMTIELRDMRLQEKGVPNDRSFRFPEDPDVSKVIQIDEDCGS